MTERRGSGRKPARPRPPPRKPARTKRVPARETRTEISAGGVVYRREDGKVKILLAARRTRRGDLAWGLAKGGIEPDETLERAAVREVREETGIEADRKSVV